MDVQARIEPGDVRLSLESHEGICELSRKCVTARFVTAMMLYSTLDFVLYCLFCTAVVECQ